MTNPASFNKIRLAVLMSVALLCIDLHEVLSGDPEKERLAVSLNETAIFKMQKRDLDGALRDLMAALAYSNENPHVRKNLSVVYYEMGLRELNERNRVPEAKRYLRLALGIDSENEYFKRGYSTVLYREAQSKAERGMNKEALEYFAEAAKWDPVNISAWLEASHYAWMTQRLDLARQFLDRAKAIDPDDANAAVMENHLAKAKSEIVLERNESRHFILAADPEYVREMGSHTILYQLENAYQKASQKMTYYTNMKMTVVFYSKEDFQAHWRLSDRVQGLYDGKLRIPLFHPGEDPDARQAVIMHELTHAFIHQLSDRTLPDWLDEGLAQWVEGRTIQGQIKEALLSHVKAGRAPSLRHIGDELNSGNTLALMKSFGVVQYLIEQKGIRRLVRLIREYGQGAEIAALMTQHYGLTVEDLESRWYDWLTRKS